MFVLRKTQADNRGRLMFPPLWKKKGLISESRESEGEWLQRVVIWIQGGAGIVYYRRRFWLLGGGCGASKSYLDSSPQEPESLKQSGEGKIDVSRMVAIFFFLLDLLKM